jgi:hypothetical protein
MKKLSLSAFFLIVFNSINIFAQDQFVEHGKKELEKTIAQYKISAEAQKTTQKIAAKTCDCLQRQEKDLKDAAKGKDVLKDCLAEESKVELRLLDIQTGSKLDDNTIGSLVSNQLLANKCDLYLSLVLEVAAKPSAEDKTESINNAKAKMMGQLKELGLTENAFPIMEKVSQGLCNYLVENKSKLEKANSMTVFGEMMAKFFEQESSIAFMEELGKMAHVEIDDKFGEAIGRMAGEYLTQVVCPDFMEIVSKVVANQTK